MEQKPATIPSPGRGTAIGLSIVVVLVGIVFLVVVLRSRTTTSPKRAVVPASSPSEGAYDKASASRDEYIRQSVQALEAAADKTDRVKVKELSDELLKQGERTVAPILEALKKHGGWNPSMALLSVLGQIQDPSTINALEEYYKTLKPDDAAYKIEVVRLLSRKGGGLTRDALCRLLAGETHPHVRDEISKLLVAMGMTPEEMLGLKNQDRALLEKDVITRDALRKRIEAMEKMDAKTDTGLAEVRKASIEEPAIAVAVIAFKKLEERGDGKAASILVERVKAKAESQEAKIIRTNALSSLARMKVSDARTAMREFVLSGEPGLRREAISLIGAFGDEAMIPVLEQATKADASEVTRAQVEQAIRAIKTKDTSNPSAR